MIAYDICVRRAWPSFTSRTSSAEIFSIADRISVLRDGALVASKPVAEFNHETLVHAMLGRKPAEIFPPQTKPREVFDVLLEVDSLVGRDLSGASLKVRAGEIVALAGLPDAGPSALLRHVFGLERATSGSIKIAGRTVDGWTPRAAIRRRLAYLPADRLQEGILPLMSVLKNAEATSEAMHATSDVTRRRRAMQSLRRLSVRATSVMNLITSLIGRQPAKDARGAMARRLSQKFSCLTIRREASTSAPSRKFTTSCAGSPTPALRSFSRLQIPLSLRVCRTAYYSSAAAKWWKSSCSASPTPNSIARSRRHRLRQS